MEMDEHHHEIPDLSIRGYLILPAAFSGLNKR